MSKQDKGRPLPKFGEWDVNNPASAEGFTVIFSKARDDNNKTTAADRAAAAAQRGRNEGGLKPDPNYEYPQKSKSWFCCV